MTVAGWTLPIVVAADSAASSELGELFARYNPTVWPGHLVAYAAGIGTLALLVWRPGATASRITSGLLAAAWLWLGVVFHGLYATDVDPVLGGAYAVAFVVQAMLLVRAGVVRDDLVVTSGHGSVGVVGWSALAYALIIYPLLGIALGARLPRSAAVRHGAVPNNDRYVRAVAARAAATAQAPVCRPIAVGGPRAARRGPAGNDRRPRTVRGRCAGSGGRPRRGSASLDGACCAAKPPVAKAIPAASALDGDVESRTSKAHR